MYSPQSLVSPFDGAGGFEKRNSNLFVESAGCLSLGIGVHRSETTLSDIGEILGVLEVFVHKATRIYNISIYNEHDVYAKVCLTSDPEIAISTKTIRGGGNNPVFNDRVLLNVRTMETSLKCEIWMVSHYYEDQLLGFTLVPLIEVIVNNGKLGKEFPLSSTELFDSPAGFVQLSIAYSAASSGLFPDPTKNRIMFSEYFGITCPCSCSRSYFDTGKEISQPVGAKTVESISNCRFNSVEFQNVDCPTSVSTNGFSFVKIPITGDAESNAKGVMSSNTSIQPMISMNNEPELKVKQQDFVDMYMNSMQEITKSFEFPTSFGNSNVDQRLKTTPKNSGSKIFYGSRAFF